MARAWCAVRAACRRAEAAERASEHIAEQHVSKRCVAIRSTARFAASARRHAARTAHRARTMKWGAGGACVRGAFR
eukprot:11180458-Lingulodinium_polyedra.AAC.1